MKSTLPREVCFSSKSDHPCPQVPSKILHVICLEERGRIEPNEEQKGENENAGPYTFMIREGDMEKQIEDVEYTEEDGDRRHEPHVVGGKMLFYAEPHKKRRCR